MFQTVVDILQFTLMCMLAVAIIRINRRLRMALQLEAYAEHEWRCAARQSGPCTCGLDALLKKGS